MPQPQPLFIFDIDGTLLNSVHWDDAAYIKTWKEFFEIDLTQTDWSVYKNVTDEGLTQDIYAQYFNQTLPIDTLVGFKSHFFTNLKSLIQKVQPVPHVIPGIDAFLKSLVDKGIAIAFATGCWEQSAMIKFGLLTFVCNDYPLGNSDDHFVRSEITKRAVLLSEKRYKTQFQQLVYFGDGVWDYTTSTGMGMEFVGIDFNGSGILDHTGANLIVKDFTSPERILSFLGVS